MKEQKKSGQLDVGGLPQKPGQKYAALLNQYFKPISIFVFIVLIVFGYIIAIVPKMQAKSARVDTLDALAREVKELQADSDLLSRYSDKIIEFTPEEERKLSQALPDAFDLPSTVVQLSQLAGDNDLVIENISAEPVVVNGLSDSNIKRVDIDLSVNIIGGNDYGKFARFITALESSLMIFDVRAISFVPKEVGYKLELSTYYYSKR
jgi:Tfp pilus assembly protein PilO